MPFKYRLQIFFVILTILPLAVAGWAIQEISATNRADRVDLELAATADAAAATYRGRTAEATNLAAVLASQPEVQAALRTGDTQQLERIFATAEERTGLPLYAVDANQKVIAGTQPVGAGAGDAFAAEVSGGGRPDRGRRPAQGGAAGPGQGCAARPGADRDLGRARLPGQRRSPRRSSPSRSRGPTQIEAFGEHWRGLSVPVVNDTQIAALYPQAKLDSAIQTIRARTALVVGIAILIVGLLAWLLAHSLTSSLRLFAARARDVAAGRFDQELPVRGDDEFARFGRAFNDMSHQLAQRIDELERERKRVREAGARFGNALAATHDVTGLLEVVLDSAIAARRRQRRPPAARRRGHEHARRAAAARRRRRRRRPARRRRCATARASRAAPCSRCRRSTPTRPCRC